MRGAIIATVIACIILIGGAILFSANGNSGDSRQIPLDPTYMARVADGYWQSGSGKPEVTLLEYTDLQCPSCIAAQPIIDDALRQTNDFVQYRVRFYPLADLQKAVNDNQALRAAEAAGRQGKFWQMFSILNVNESAWAGQTADTLKNTIDQYAQSLAVNMSQFRSDIKNSAIEDPINRDVTSANQINRDANSPTIQGAPTFFVNGKVISSFPATSADLIKILESNRVHPAVPAP